MKKIIPVLLSALLLLSLVACSNRTEELIKNYEDLSVTFNETEKVTNALSLYPSIWVGGSAAFSAETPTACIKLLYNALSSEQVDNVTAVTGGRGTITKTVVTSGSTTVRTEYVINGVYVEFKYTTEDDTTNAKDGVLSLNGVITIDNENGIVTTDSLSVLGVSYRDMYLKGNLTKGIYEKATIGGCDVDIRLVNNSIGPCLL